MAMNPAIKARWVAALRSGEYKQGKGLLRHAGRFCCLGVLCNLHAQDHPEIAAKETSREEYMGSDNFPHSYVTSWADLNPHVSVWIRDRRDTLASHNDAGRTFAEIADAIEGQL